MARGALSAYTWLHTKPGPQKSWLHRLGKSADLACPCSHPTQSGKHITFECPTFKDARREFLGARTEWGELDAPVWVKEGENDAYDAIEAFFDFIYHQIS